MIATGMFWAVLLAGVRWQQVVAGDYVPHKPSSSSAVQAVNRKYQRLLQDSVWSYYQLIGAQNKNLETPNRHLGPGIPGPQHSNVQNLVNTTLETYTQEGFSCACCHLNAFPHGVDRFPPYEKRFEDLHVMSFLLLNAKSSSAPAGDAGCTAPTP